MNTATAAHSDSQRTHVRWVILALLFMASFVAYVLRTNMSIAGESIMADLGLSTIQFGMVLSAFAWGYALFQFPGGVFGDIVGCRRYRTIDRLVDGNSGVAGVLFCDGTIGVSDRRGMVVVRKRQPGRTSASQQARAELDQLKPAFIRTV